MLTEEQVRRGLYKPAKWIKGLPPQTVCADQKKKETEKKHGYEEEERARKKQQREKASQWYELFSGFAALERSVPFDLLGDRKWKGVLCPKKKKKEKKKHRYVYNWLVWTAVSPYSGIQKP